jgi:hypothetical protein
VAYLDTNMIDDDFLDRTKLAQVIDWFAHQLSAPERADFMNRLEAMPLDAAGKELLGVLAKLDHELSYIKGEK